PKWDGGQYEGDETSRLVALCLAIQLGADYVDVELKRAMIVLSISTRLSTPSFPLSKLSKKRKQLISKHKMTILNKEALQVESDSEDSTEENDENREPVLVESNNIWGSIPKLNMLFHSVYEAYDFYNAYARFIGFIIRINHTAFSA
ncbi:hypothetical protein IFM89_000592, partial [Coptis chinensis]